MFDIQEHIWQRKQKENQRIKFDRKVTENTHRRMIKELNFNLLKLQREKLLFKRETIESVSQINYPHSSSNSQRVISLYDNRRIDYLNRDEKRKRVNSAKLFKDIVQSKMY